MEKTEESLRNYTKGHCWQYDIRLKNREEDMIRHGLTEADVANLKVSDFVFAHEDKAVVFEEIRAFIERHEWLGRLSLYPTHIFTARYNKALAGVVVMDMPNAFSKLLGEDTKRIERLISRGACVSWSPKNLASSLIMYAIRWMTQNTQYRLFTAYSDPEAKELGTIYQACNFYYIGQKSGTGYQYRIESGRWVSDRYFRSRSVYKRLARGAGIVWDASWQDGDMVYFDRMPAGIAENVRALSKEYQLSCPKRRMAPKHKYAYVMGRDKGETKYLRKIFEKRNRIYPYPTNRGQ